MQTMTARQMAETSHNLSRDGNTATTADGRRWVWIGRDAPYGGFWQQAVGRLPAPPAPSPRPDAPYALPLTGRR